MKPIVSLWSGMYCISSECHPYFKDEKWSTDQLNENKQKKQILHIQKRTEKSVDSA